MKSFTALMVGLIVVCIPLAAAEVLKFYHDNPEWQQNWEAVAQTSLKDIGIGLDVTPFDTEVYKTRVKVDLTTSRAPAVFKWWFGYRALELVDAGLVADLSDVWDEIGTNFAPGVREALTIKGVTYGVPLHVSYWIWYYNKPLFEKYSLKTPKTWDEFMKQLEFFKQHGIYGIGNTIGKSRWTSFIVFQELLYRIDADLYVKLMNGEAHWTDPKVVQAMEIWKDMLEKGFFAPMDATYVEDFPRMFKEGKLAYAPFGDWYGSILQAAGLVSGKDYDVCILPAIAPEGEEAIILEISPLMAGRKSPQLKLAKEWLKWWGGSAKAAEIRWELWRFAPNTLISREKIAQEDPARAHEFELVEAYPKKLIRFWEATPVEIVEYAVDAFNTMLVEPDKYMELLEDIENKAAEVWPEYGVKY
ncbi:MAG: hypothetical protein DRG83_08565 [Deltaproteobacteria bacterium]|nr:MAG: hypothetical protein DRG83_08565 [Deltaproteobacteria bacterium]